MQTEYAKKAYPASFRRSFTEFGVFCDRIVLADTMLEAEFHAVFEL